MSALANLAEYPDAARLIAEVAPAPAAVPAHGVRPARAARRAPRERAEPSCSLHAHPRGRGRDVST